MPQQESLGLAKLPGENDENFATTVARGMNKINRAVGLPPNRGAIGVQQNADMLKAERISDAVPRRSEQDD